MFLFLKISIKKYYFSLVSPAFTHPHAALHTLTSHNSVRSYSLSRGRYDKGTARGNVRPQCLYLFYFACCEIAKSRAMFIEIY